MPGSTNTPSSTALQRGRGCRPLDFTGREAPASEVPSTGPSSSPSQTSARYGQYDTVQLRPPPSASQNLAHIFPLHLLHPEQCPPRLQTPLLSCRASPVPAACCAGNSPALGESHGCSDCRPDPAAHAGPQQAGEQRTHSIPAHEKGMNHRKQSQAQSQEEDDSPARPPSLGVGARGQSSTAQPTLCSMVFSQPAVPHRSLCRDTAPCPALELSAPICSEDGNQPRASLDPCPTGTQGARKQTVPWFPSLCTFQLLRCHKSEDPARNVTFRTCLPVPRLNLHAAGTTSSVR